MNLMFWKKKPAGNDEDLDAEGAAATSSSGEMPDLAEDVLEEAARIKAARRKKRMLIFGALGLVILLLLGLLIALWKLFFVPKHQEHVPPVPASEQKIVLPSPHGNKKLIKLPDIELPRVERQVAPQVLPQTSPQMNSQTGGMPQTQDSPEEMEALKKRNEELEAQLNALQQQRQQSSYGSDQRGAAAALGGGQVMLGSKDAKETAMTLKAAIEAMNASTGDYSKKPTVKPPAKKTTP